MATKFSIVFVLHGALVVSVFDQQTTRGERETDEMLVYAKRKITLAFVFSSHLFRHTYTHTNTRMDGIGSCIFHRCIFRQ